MTPIKKVSVYSPLTFVISVISVINDINPYKYHNRYKRDNGDNGDNYEWREVSVYVSTSSHPIVQVGS